MQPRRDAGSKKEQNMSAGRDNQSGFVRLFAVVAAVMLSPAVTGVAQGADTTVSCNAGTGNVPELVKALNDANTNPGPDVVRLSAGCVYTVVAPDNFWYGPNG